MRIKIRYFGQFRDITGKAEEEIDTKEGVTVLQLRDQIREKYPRIAAKNEVLVAVNSTFTNLDVVIKPEDKVAFFPPVSGG